MDSLHKLLHKLKLFGSCSGLKPNIAKTEVIRLGPSQKDVDIYSILKIPKPSEPPKILGVYFTYDNRLRDRLNLENLIKSVKKLLKKGWKFLKKLWCCVGGGNKVIWLYQLSWKYKLATVTSYKADVSSVSPSSERKLLAQWRRRNLTILGKIQVIKSHTQLFLSYIKRSRPPYFADCAEIWLAILF